ncbi:MAG: hypothetical protein EOO61_21555, partial [Hymenobacter sp.]
FIQAGRGGGIGFGLSDTIENAEVREDVIIDPKIYHTVYELKNGQGPAPIKTSEGWLHLAHGVRNTAAGLRYVLYLFLTSLEDVTKVVYKPGGYFIAPEGDERIGDVSNVAFSNGWVADEEGNVFIYYASSDTRMHVATSTIDQLLDYVKNTPADGLRSATSVQAIYNLIDKNKNLHPKAVLNIQDAQESKITQQFSNLIEMMKSKKMLDQVSYLLMIHDLTSERPFRKPSKLLENLSDEARRHALEVYQDLYKKRNSLSLFNGDQNGLNKVLESMQYDDKSLLKTLLIYRAENSDFINVQFDAEDPELSAFVVNTLCKEFIGYYTLMVRENQRKAVDFLAKLLKDKQDSLAVKTQALK